MAVALKHCVWERHGDALVVLLDPRETIELHDPDGQVSELLGVLASGACDPPALCSALAARGIALTLTEAADAIAALDSLGLVEDAAGCPPQHRDQRSRNNLAFFGLFSSAAVSRAELDRQVRDAHVLILGVGGLGANALQSLAGLGVGRLTLLDADVVERCNLNRQFVFRDADVGRPKTERAAEWVAEFNPGIDVTAIQQRITSPADVASLLPDVNVVVSGIDEPPEVDLWVNEASVLAGVPHIVGGMAVTELMYYSVDPGRSPCRACTERARAGQMATPGPEGAGARLTARLTLANHGIGPAYGLAGSLVAFEALRYLTGYQPPWSAGATVRIDLREGCVMRRQPWTADPGCELCGLARKQRAGRPLTAAGMA
jgi:molybdopterin-synthase adenylyltransferase